MDGAEEIPSNARKTVYSKVKYLVMVLCRYRFKPQKSALGIR
jgi:hypothetical protein